MAYKKIVVFDFDGCLSTYESGWQGADVINDEPVPGMKEEIQKIRQAGYSVIVVSSRCYQEGGIGAIQNWLHKHNIDVDGVTHEKPIAFLTVDDRAICFKGKAEGLLEQINEFTPWTKK